MNNHNHDLFWEMAFLVSNGGKPCYFRDYYFLREEGNPLIKSSDIFKKIKKHLPKVRFYIYKEETDNEFLNLNLFIYKFEFQKEILKSRYSKKPTNNNLIKWSVSGLLFGYSPQEIQEAYNASKLKHGEIFT